MKKIKVENYEKPKYSTLKMVTGKILPAGLAVATIISTTPTFTALAGNLPMISPIVETTAYAGGAPAPYIKEIESEDLPVSVMVDGNKIDFDVEPIIEDGVTLVPLRYIFEALNAVVTWDNETQTATAVKQNDTIAIKVDSSKMTINDEEIDLIVPAKLVDNRILVPIRAVSEAFSATVNWDGATKEISITTTETAVDDDIVILAGDIPAPVLE